MTLIKVRNIFLDIHIQTTVCNLINNFSYLGKSIENSVIHIVVHAHGKRIDKFRLFYRGELLKKLMNYQNQFLMLTKGS